MKTSRSKKGQFSIIAALLVSVILVSAVISTYTMVRHAPLQDSPKVLTAIGEMNSDIKRILDFTVGYYGSILRVTGNSIYAQTLTTRYLSSGLVNIHVHILNGILHSNLTLMMFQHAGTCPKATVKVAFLCPTLWLLLVSKTSNMKRPQP